ncbi:MAG TPA: hypothetical protein VI913_00190 [Candidatus Peribacteraceae bacterium]|nr:hypothetical protein [Candidatus Peribacteraceae bacterium]
MAKKAPRLTQRLQRHGIPIVASLCALLVIGSQIHSRLAPSLNERLADIAVEHKSPLELKLALSQRDTEGIIDIEHNGNEAVHISLPSEWVRAEVRNVALEAVLAEPPMLSFTRWTIPAGAGVRFLIQGMPDGFMLHHESDATLELKTTFVDLDADTVQTDVRLVKDGAIRVW